MAAQAVTITPEDLLRFERLEQELATAGREADRTSVRKALTVLRRHAIERLEHSLAAERLPAGTLPQAGEMLQGLPTPEAERLAALQQQQSQRVLTTAEKRELQALLRSAEDGAMRNVLSLVRENAPESEAYLRALRAYRRSFSSRARKPQNVAV